MTAVNIINDLVRIGAEKLSDNSVFYEAEADYFYFSIYDKYLTATHCNFHNQHEADGDKIMSHYLIEDIVSLPLLFSCFRTTKNLVCLFK